MAKVTSKRDIEILEQRGLWKASSYLHRLVKRLISKNQPLRIYYFNEAHKKIFGTIGQFNMAGKYRKHNGPELKRIDGTILKMTDWRNIPSEMAELDFELKEYIKNPRLPKNEKDYKFAIFTAAKLSHRLTCIHPFENGNGRISRLLLSAILLRFGLSDIAIKEPREKYLRAMRQADDGDYSSFEDIILKGLIENKKRNLKITRLKQAQIFKRRRHSKSKKKR